MFSSLFRGRNCGDETKQMAGKQQGKGGGVKHSMTKEEVLRVLYQELGKLEDELSKVEKRKRCNPASGKSTQGDDVNTRTPTQQELDIAGALEKDELRRILQSALVQEAMGNLGFENQDLTQVQVPALYKNAKELQKKDPCLYHHLEKRRVEYIARVLVERRRFKSRASEGLRKQEREPSIEAAKVEILRKNQLQRESRQRLALQKVFESEQRTVNEKSRQRRIKIDTLEKRNLNVVCARERLQQELHDNSEERRKQVEASKAELKSQETRRILKLLDRSRERARRAETVKQLMMTGQMDPSSADVDEKQDTKRQQLGKHREKVKRAASAQIIRRAQDLRANLASKELHLQRVRQINSEILARKSLSKRMRQADILARLKRKALLETVAKKRGVEKLRQEKEKFLERKRVLGTIETNRQEAMKRNFKWKSEFETVSGRSEGEFLPGPGEYSVPSSIEFKGFKIGNENPKSEIDWLVSRSKLIPGPGQYKPFPDRPSNPGGTFSKSEVPSELEWIILRGPETPGPGEYELGTTIGAESPSFSIGSPIHTSIKHTASFDGPGPGEYDL